MGAGDMGMGGMGMGGVGFPGAFPPPYGAFPPPPYGGAPPVVIAPQAPPIVVTPAPQVVVPPLPDFVPNDGSIYVDSTGRQLLPGERLTPGSRLVQRGGPLPPPPQPVPTAPPLPAAAAGDQGRPASSTVINVQVDAKPSMPTQPLAVPSAAVSQPQQQPLAVPSIANNPEAVAVASPAAEDVNSESVGSIGSEFSTDSSLSASSIDEEIEEEEEEEEVARVKSQRAQLGDQFKPVRPTELMRKLEAHWDAQDLGPMPARVADALVACGGEDVCPELCVLRMGNAYAEHWAREALQRRGNLYPTK